jgi:hypothetical protein
MSSLHLPLPANLAAERAAQAIVELINARPRSPRPEEIAAIIEKLAVPAVTTAPCPHCDSLDREYGPATKSCP